MKCLRKIMVLLLAAVLMMSMGATAFADPDDPAGGGDDPAGGGGSDATNTVTVTIAPTYLYVLTDPDLDNPTIYIGG